MNPIANHYIGFVKFADPRHFPHVDVHAEKGSGIATIVGAVLPNLHVGQVLDPTTAHFFTRDGDVNQEDITNGAVRAWRAMRVLPVQPDRQPRRRSLLAAVRSRACSRGSWRPGAGRARHC